MRLRLTLKAGEYLDDLAVTVDNSATVAELSERLRVSHPRAHAIAASGPQLTMRVNPGTAAERTLAPGTPMGDAGVRSGDVITLTGSSGIGAVERQRVATLEIRAGRDAGATFALAGGTTIVGRDRACDVRLSDPMVSKRHLKVNVTDVVEVIDDNSANGTVVDGEVISRRVIRSTDEVTIGDTTFTVTLHTVGAVVEDQSGSSIPFNRSPRLDPRYAGVELVAPEPPQRPQPQNFPWLSMLAPVLMGAVMWLVTGDARSVIFIALSPILMAGSFIEGRSSAKRLMRQQIADYRAALRDLAVQLQYAADLERQGRRREHPSIDEVSEGAARLTPILWTRRPEHESYGQVRFGLGDRPSRNSVRMPTTNNTLPELWRELHDVVGQFATIDRVPIVADLAADGNVGVGGPLAHARPLAAAVVGQLVGLHSPAELSVAAVCSAASAEYWQWLKWLPHTNGELSPLEVDHLTANPQAATVLIAAIEDLVAVRSATRSSDARRALPTVVLVVEDDAAVERARLVQLAEAGPAAGVHLVWVATSLERLPAACRAFISLDPTSSAGSAGFVRGGDGVDTIELEPLDAQRAMSLGRRLAPVIDAGALVEDQSDLPRTVSLLSLAGPELADNPSEIVAAWTASNSLPPPPGAPRLKRDNLLAALVGQTSSDRLHLDLRVHGPHALVGGTTGAGKSEFLQSWILGMATAHSPLRVNFLFVDYKGGAAFADCVALPHCVGLVTDLSPHLVRRALRSLNAELRRREHVLNSKKAKDLLELERRRDPEAPPSLVIVVDEFAALVQEVPEFVDGVVNVAQRGRSLGLHLILATQRPAGVIKDNLRANTNLRVALRMADEGDSDDVIGTKQAATFDPSLPGRGVAKTGPGRLTVFQSAYVGGHTSNTPPVPSVEVRELRFGPGAYWELPPSAVPVDAAPQGPTDIKRIVDTVSAASTLLQLPASRQPWLPELATTYRLEQLPTRRTDTELVFGVIDRPDDQAQPTVAFMPDRDGNMAIYGTGGSGKSTLLRSLAVAAGFSSARGGPCHVYGLDFGTRGLAMLEGMPHVGAIINGDDQERLLRLLRTLRSTVDERAERYAKVNAGTITDYRERAGAPDEPRVLLLVDNFGAFRQAYELSFQTRAYEILESIAADGRSVGVHLIATADRAGAFTAGLSSVIQCEVALRLASEMDFTMLGVPADVFTEASPPGRGYMDDSEVQVAVLGGDASVAKQAAEITRLVKAMERAGVPVAPAVQRLPEVVPLTSFGLGAGDQPVIGLQDEGLSPLPFERTGVFLVTGPAQSGRTSTLATMVSAIRATDGSAPMVLLGHRRSSLVSVTDWMRVALNPDDMETTAREIADGLREERPEFRNVVVVVENIAEVHSSNAGDAVQDLAKACREMDGFMVVEGESSSLTGWDLQWVRSSKYGVVLQPEEDDGETLFGTPFPRVRRADFPVGRGYLVRAGRVARVQVAMPG